MVLGLVHNYPNQQLRARASSLSWGGSPTSFLTRNTCIWQVQAKYCRGNIYIVGHFLTFVEGETARKGLRTSPRSPLVVFLPMVLCSTASKVKVTRVTALGEGQERR